MKRLIIILSIFFLAFGVAQAKEYVVMKKAGSYTVHVMMDKNPLVAGQNKIEISVQDTAGAEVTDATVNVEYSMPAMPGMPAMHYKTKAELSGSRYLANVNFSMAGAWSVTIKITRAGKTQPVKFNVDVS